jgi:hypothetical protein
MDIYQISVWLSSSILMLGTFYYCRQISRGLVSPPLATFIIASITFTLALFIYTRKPSWSFSANIGLTTAFASAWTVCTYLIAKLLREKRLLLSINNWQKFSLLSAIAIFVLWVLTDNAFVCYVLLQVAALIAYTPVIQKLWNGGSDSLVFWCSLLLSSLVASYAAYTRNDLEAWIYILRAVPSTLLVVGLILKNRKMKSVS